MTRMCSTKPLEWAMNKTKRDLCVEVGTYYAGWTKFLADNYTNVITLQTPNQRRLNHVENTSEGEFSEDLPWKKIMKERIPTEYHGRYSFDFLAQQLESMPNVTCILKESPLDIPFLWKYDLCTIDISRDPSDHKLQYDYWKQFANTGAILLMGVYFPREYDNFSMSSDDFFNHIVEPWERVPGNENYIAIQF